MATHEIAAGGKAFSGTELGDLAAEARRQPVDSATLSHEG